MTDDPEAGPRTTNLRQTFNLAADRYHRARPRYPAALLRSLCDGAGLEPGSRVVEIGPATGVASEQLADRGLALTCIELGPDLAAEAAVNLRRFPAVEVINEGFETWDGPRGAFDAVVAATSWHWLDPQLAAEQAHRLLVPDGHLAFWSATHVFPEHGDPIFEQFQPIYDRLGMSSSADQNFPRPGALTAAPLPPSARFEPVLVEQFDWELTYDAAHYIDLLCTFSGHIALEPEARRELFDEIRRLMALRPDGLLRRHWGAVLQIFRAVN